MSQTNPVPADSNKQTLRAAPGEQFNQGMKAFGELVEKITPWLVEFGSWLFGGLIAFNLLVIAALLTVGPVEPAILVSTIAFALALPMEVAGLFLLRLDQDLKHVGFEEEVVQTLQEMGVTVREQDASSTIIEAGRKRRTRSILFYCLGILVLSVLLTVTGMTAALWRMAWWIGVAFIVMVLISQVIVIVAIATIQSPNRVNKQKSTRHPGNEITGQPAE